MKTAVFIYGLTGLCLSQSVAAALAPHELFASKFPDANDLGNINSLFDDSRWLADDVKKYFGIEANELLQVPEQEAGRFFANMDPQKFQQFRPTDIEPYLPRGWKLGDNWALQVPANTQLGFQLKKPLQPYPGLKLPSLFDLNSHFGLGGLGDSDSPLSKFNQILGNMGIGQQFRFEQNERGIVRLKGTVGGDFAFMPDSENSKQLDNADPQAQEGIRQHPKTGRYSLITADRKAFPMIPAPKDPLLLKAAFAHHNSLQDDLAHPDSLDDALAHIGTINIGDNGMVSIDNLPPFTDEERPKHRRPLSFMFDAIVHKLPADAELKPGLHKIKADLLPQLQAKLDDVFVCVYEDNTLQRLHPTVAKPDDFIQKALEIDGILAIDFRDDGRFRVEVSPAFGIGAAINVRLGHRIKRRLVANDEDITPRFGDDNGSTAFVYRLDDLEITQPLVIEIPESD